VGHGRLAGCDGLRCVDAQTRRMRRGRLPNLTVPIDPRPQYPKAAVELVNAQLGRHPQAGVEQVGPGFYILASPSPAPRASGISAAFRAPAVNRDGWKTNGASPPWFPLPRRRQSRSSHRNDRSTKGAKSCRRSGALKRPAQQLVRSKSYTSANLAPEAKN
jgi:hypothetical protein